MSCGSITEQVINRIEIDQTLERLINGKRVCLCGPAKSNIGSGYGDYIDNFDTVCRINFHLTSPNSWDPNLNKDFGQRTDIMFTGIGIFLKAYYQDLQNKNQPESPYHCFHDLKYMYLIDPFLLPEYIEKNRDQTDQSKEYGGYVTTIDQFQDKLLELKIDYGMINLWLTSENKKYMSQHLNLSDQVKITLTNSGIHAIQTILRHHPKELFITGMNFGNFGKGGLADELYPTGTEYKILSPKDISNRRSSIHTRPISLIFFSQILDEHPEIKLDKLLNDYFTKFSHLLRLGKLINSPTKLII